MRYLLTLLLIVGIVAPTYALIITDGYEPSVSLKDDTLFMTGGGIGTLTLEDSTATIEGTSALVEGSGGIWTLSLVENSTLDFYGGEVHLLSLNNDATAILSGGLIEEIWSTQSAWKWDYGVDPPEWVPNPHITIIYSGDLPTVDLSNVLTGLWGSGDPFSIYLSDVPEGYGYSPAFENIQFELIPEPATLLLFGLGGLLIRGKK